MAASVKYEYAVNRIFQIAVRDEVVNSLPSGGERSEILLGGIYLPGGEEECFGDSNLFQS